MWWECVPAEHDLTHWARGIHEDGTSSPGVATADIDVRLLPDQDPAAFLETLKAVVGDGAVHFTTLLQPKTPLESPINTDLFHAIERAAHDREPSAFVTTPMETAAAADRPTYRKLRTTPEFSPFLIRAEIQRGMHGNDERLSVRTVSVTASTSCTTILRYAR